MSRPAGGLTKLERLLPALEQLVGASLALRVWRADGAAVRLLTGAPVSWVPRLQEEGARLDTPDGPAWFAPLPDPGQSRGGPVLWLEMRGRKEPEAAARESLVESVACLVEAEREAAQVAAELSDRYEEIDLVYTISEILGHTIRLDEAARRILQEVATVVGARRASLFVLDQDRHVLRLVAAKGMVTQEVDPIELDDPVSVTARAFRDMRIQSSDPAEPEPAAARGQTGRSYRGRAFLAVPVMYGAPGDQARPIGVINLTDRHGPDLFSAGDRKLVAAIANQVGAAIENARLVARDLGQQRVRRELELAHDLQLKLLPSPAVLGTKADLAARCRPADSVGGDFYNLLRLHGDRVGIMIGDVSNHGFGAALIMALAMAASGIHAESAAAPAQVLGSLEQSLAAELARTEMYLSLFYAVVDPAEGVCSYANAGHPHAFLVRGATGEAKRLEATRTPLGLGPARPAADRKEPWKRREDILCLFTDGIADAVGEPGHRFGEDRILAHVRALRTHRAQEILEAIFADLAAFTGGTPSSDDRTLLIAKV
ncbi:MAG TPA: SpoIIE family protein phosphatase [Gemmatimonadales bacterium]|nr:SpoIIE family protein phosphatase [Gemmatimonadales bacterium]